MPRPLRSSHALLILTTCCAFLVATVGSTPVAAQEDVRLAVHLSDEYQERVQQSLEDFSWEEFAGHLRVDAELPDRHGPLHLNAVAVQDGEVVGSTRVEAYQGTVPGLIGQARREIARFGEEWFPGSKWIPGTRWFPGSEWFPGSSWIPGSNWVPNPDITWIPGSGWVPGSHWVAIWVSPTSEEITPQDVMLKPLALVFEEATPDLDLPGVDAPSPTDTLTLPPDYLDGNR